MNPAIVNSQFVPIALPIVVTLIVAAWLNGKRLDGLKVDFNGRLNDFKGDVNRSFDELIQRLGRFEARFIDLDHSPLARRS